MEVEPCGRITLFLTLGAVGLQGMASWGIQRKEQAAVSHVLKVVGKLIRDQSKSLLYLIHSLTWVKTEPEAKACLQGDGFCGIIAYKLSYF